MDVQHFYECRVRAEAGENLSQALKRLASGLSERAHRDMRGEGFDPATAKLQFVLDSLNGSQITFNDVEMKMAAEESVAGGLLRLMATIERAGRDDAVKAISPPASQSGGNEREIGWDGGRKMTTVYSYSELAVGKRIDGPALVESAETSCVIPQGWQAETDSFGALKVWRD